MEFAIELFYFSNKSIHTNSPSNEYYFAFHRQVFAIEFALVADELSALESISLK